MAGPLSDLGQAIALGTRDYATIRRQDELHAQARQEQLDDERRARGYQVDDRNDARAYEKQLYDSRRLDAIKTDLVAKGLLDPKQVDDPVAIKAALDRAGIDYQRAADELAGYKAQLPKLIEAVGTIDGADKVMAMLPENVAQARSIMQGAYTKLGARVDEDRTKGETNKKTAAALYTVELDNLRKTESELTDITNGVVTNADRLKAFREAAAKLGYPSEDKIPQDRRGEVQAQADKILSDSRLTRGYQLQQSLQQIQRRMDNIGDNARTGIYGYLNMDKANGTAPVAPSGPVKSATAAESEAALRALQGDRVPAPATSANPAGLGDGYGGLMGLIGKADNVLPKISPSDMAKGVSGLGLVEPIARGLNYIAGGEKRVAEGDAQRAGGVIPALGLDVLGGANPIDNANADYDKQVLDQIQTVQSQLNGLEPQSPAAVQLRSKLYSLQFQLSKPAKAALSLGVQ